MQNSNNNMPRVLPQSGFGRVECTDLTPTSKVERLFTVAKEKKIQNEVMEVKE